MPGKGHRFSAKEDREQKHIAKSELENGMSFAEANLIGWKTVQKRHQQAHHREGF
jgi:hypothetical protein